MKYIRTKDGIVPDLMNECFEKQPLPYPALGIEPVKVADTIEELCDGYVVRRYVMDEPCHWFYITKEKMKADISLRNRAYTIFGAIWTDKGLIYVAKMNEKGELELL